MARRAIMTALILGCCWLCGAATLEPIDPARSEDPPVATDTNAPVRAPTQTEKVEPIEERWPNGKLRFRRGIIRDKDGNEVSHGITTQWWENGEKKSELGFANGARHGRRLAWYRTGEKWSRGAYDDGKPTGTWTVWYPDGTVEQQWQYDEKGARHGMHTFSHANGRKRMEVEFVHGYKQGFETFWTEDGHIRLEINYGRERS